MQSAGDRSRGGLGRVGLTCLLAASGGILSALAFPGVGLWPLAFVCYVPLFLAVDRLEGERRLRGFGTGLLFGFVGWTATCYWFLPMLRAFAELPELVAVLASLVFWVYHGTQYAIFAWLWAKLRRKRVNATLAAVLLWGALELLYPQMFPSYHAAFLHEVLPLIQIADVGGPILVSMLVLAGNGLIYEILLRLLEKRRFPATSTLAVGGAFLLVFVYGAVRIGQTDDRVAEARHLSVGLVQANVLPSEKEVAPGASIERHLALSREILRGGVVNLLIWPESACDLTLSAQIESVRDKVSRGLPAPLLFGTKLRERVGGTPRRTVSALLAGAQGQVVARYDKNVLVPFSESLPLVETIPALRKVFPKGGRFLAGRTHPSLDLGKLRLQVLMCFEDVLPRYVREVVRDGDPDLLVNLTNDAWFGPTTEPRIHLALARFRAVEQRRALVRATNSGISAIIDPAGRVVQETAVFEQATLRARVPLLRGTQTVYGRTGDWAGWLALCWVAWALRPRRRPSGEVARHERNTPTRRRQP